MDVQDFRIETLASLLPNNQIIHSFLTRKLKRNSFQEFERLDMIVEKQTK